MEITNLRYVQVKGTLDYDGPLNEERLVRPIDIYPEYRARRPTWPLGGREGSPTQSRTRFYSSTRTRA